MKSIKVHGLTIAVLSIFLLLISSKTFSQSQVKYSVKDNLSLVVDGTAPGHNWSMQSTVGNCDAIFVLDNKTGHISGISSLSFITPSKGLKSKHGSMMDNKAYSALKADKNANISFILSSATITTSDGINYNIKCAGKLTIAGVTKETEITATGKLNADKSISVIGSKKISMKDYGVEAPTFFMVISTGNDVTLTFQLTLKIVH